MPPVTDKLFTGQQRETSSGIYHYGARFYNAEIGRFLQADSIVPEPGNPQAFNRYAYVLNNPIRYSDPTGHKWDDGSKGGCTPKNCAGLGWNPQPRQYQQRKIDLSKVPLPIGGLGGPAAATRTARLTPQAARLAVAGATATYLAGDNVIEAAGKVDLPKVSLPNTWFSGGEEEEEDKPYEAELDFGEEFEGLDAGEISEKYLRGKGTPFKKWLGKGQEGAARALETEPADDVTDIELKAYHEVAKQAIKNPKKDAPLQHDRLEAIEKWLGHRGY